MIDLNVLEAFSTELTKIAKKKGMGMGTKILVGGVGLGGLGLGFTGEQAKDDLLAGRRRRKYQETVAAMQKYSPTQPM